MAKTVPRFSESCVGRASQRLLFGLTQPRTPDESLIAARLKACFFVAFDIHAVCHGSPLLHDALCTSPHAARRGCPSRAALVAGVREARCRVCRPLSRWVRYRGGAPAQKERNR
jgi:hypothetical protein